MVAPGVSRRVVRPRREAAITSALGIGAGSVARIQTALRPPVSRMVSVANTEEVAVCILVATRQGEGASAWSTEARLPTERNVPVKAATILRRTVTSAALMEGGGYAYTPDAPNGAERVATVLPMMAADDASPKHAPCTKCHPTQATALAPSDCAGVVSSPLSLRRHA